MVSQLEEHETVIVHSLRWCWRNAGLSHQILQIQLLRLSGLRSLQRPNPNPAWSNQSTYGPTQDHNQLWIVQSNPLSSCMKMNIKILVAVLVLFIYHITRRQKRNAHTPAWFHFIPSPLESGRISWSWSCQFSLIKYFFYFLVTYYKRVLRRYAQCHTIVILYTLAEWASTAWFSLGCVGLSTLAFDQWES